MHVFLIMFTSGQTLEGMTWADLQDQFDQASTADRLKFDYQPHDTPDTTCRANIPAAQIACLTTVIAEDIRTVPSPRAR